MKASDRFTDRVENYHLYRPSYAEEFLKDLEQFKQADVDNKVLR
ncbi:hypothetical protein WJR50_07090 [Catalinimonas sp. 4WD22]